MVSAAGERVITALLSLPRLTVRAYLSVLPAAIKKEIKDESYRVYVTDALKCLCENTAKRVSGSYIKMRFVDMVDPKPDDTRTKDEIVDAIKSKLRKIGGE